MTPRQAELLRIVERHIMATGMAPTYDEMRDALGVSGKSVVHGLIDELIGDGRLIRRPGKARGLDLAPRSDGGVGIRQVTSDALRAELARRGELA